MKKDIEFMFVELMSWSRESQGFFFFFFSNVLFYYLAPPRELVRLDR